VSDLLDPLFGDPAVDGIFSPAATVATMVEVEVALAEASASLGIIPAPAADVIRATASADRIDLAALAGDAAKAGNLAIPLLRQLKATIAPASAEAAEWLHWGATSQDLLDTTLVLQLRRAGATIVDRTRRAAGRAAALAEEHAGTPMAGRTWLQQGAPTSFGLVMAGHAEALKRCGTRLVTGLAQAAVVQLGGSVGTLAAFGERGPDLAKALGNRLALAAAPPWHSHRDRLAEVATALGILAGAHGKLGRDVGLWSQTELGEVHEGTGGGSSAMPQKRNPISAAVAIAAAARAPGLVATMLGAMPQEHQRSLGLWPAEWATLPELTRLVAGSARAVEEIASGLVVDEAQMAANLAAGQGLLFAEALAVALTGPLGPGPARAAVGALVEATRGSGRTLREVAASDMTVRRHLDAGALERVFDPSSQLGAVRRLIQDG